MMKLETYDSRGGLNRARVTPSAGMAQTAQRGIAAERQEFANTLVESLDKIESMVDLSKTTKADSLAATKLNDLYLAAESDPDLHSAKKWNNMASDELNKIANSLPSHLRGKFLAKNTPYLTSRQVQFTNNRHDMLKKDLEVDFKNTNAKNRIAFAQSGSPEALANTIALYSEFQATMGVPEKTARVELKKEIESFKEARIEYEIQNLDLDVIAKKLNDDAYNLNDKKKLAQYKDDIDTERASRKGVSEYKAQQTIHNTENKIDAIIAKDPKAFTGKQIDEFVKDGRVSPESAAVYKRRIKKTFLAGRTSDEATADWLNERFSKEAQEIYVDSSEKRKFTFINRWMLKGRQMVDQGVMKENVFLAQSQALMGQRSEWASEFFGAGTELSETFNSLYVNDKSLFIDFLQNLNDEGVMNASTLNPSPQGMAKTANKMADAAASTTRLMLDRKLGQFNKVLQDTIYKSRMKKHQGLAMAGVTKEDMLTKTLSTVDNFVFSMIRKPEFSEVKR